MLWFGGKHGSAIAAHGGEETPWNALFQRACGQEIRAAPEFAGNAASNLFGKHFAIFTVMPRKWIPGNPFGVIVQNGLFGNATPMGRPLGVLDFQVRYSWNEGENLPWNAAEDLRADMRWRIAFR